MERPNYRIEPAQARHAGEIAILHQRYISGRTRDVWKDNYFLESYYREIVKGQKGIVYVAFAGNQMIGYAALVSQRGGLWLGSLMQKNVLRKLLSLKPRYFGQLVVSMVQKLNHEILGGKWRGIEHSLPEKACELRSIAVEKAFTGQGVGAGLLQAVLKNAETNGMVPIIAWVMEGNLPSRHLFEALGFMQMGVRFERPENAIVYAYRRGATK